MGQKLKIAISRPIYNAFQLFWRYFFVQMIKTVSSSPVVLGGNSKSSIWRCNQNGILRFHNSKKPEMALELGRKNGNFKFLPTTVGGGQEKVI